MELYINEDLLMQTRKQIHNIKENTEKIKHENVETVVDTSI